MMVTENDVFFCIGCKATKPIGEAVTLLSTGFYRAGTTDYRLGVCEIHAEMISETEPTERSDPTPR